MFDSSTAWLLGVVDLNSNPRDAIAAWEKNTLRELAKQVADVAALPIMEQRREMWRRHNRLERVRPMVLVFPEGAWRELLPASGLRCRSERARAIEWELRRRLYHHEHIHDDTAIEDWWIVAKRITNTGWGLEAQHKPSDQQTGAWAFDPVIETPADLDRLHFPQVTYDAEGTQRDLDEAQELFGDILDVQLRGISHISFHLMNLYTGWRGLEQVMWDMYDHADMLHRAMSFLQEGHQQLIQQYIDLNLLSLNNDGTYHSSGGVGYSTELPRADHDPNHIMPADMWASAEAQEMAQVSPQMHREFILAYEKPLLEPFGLNGYGCCEDLADKMADVAEIPNLRRISISPFADVDRCANLVGGRFIYSWKPHPAHLVGQFDEESIREYLRHTLDVTGDCVIEMILKDTHTCDGHPERFTRWTDIARELVETY